MIMKRLFLLLMCSFILNTCSLCHAGGLVAEDFAIHGLKLGASAEEMQQLLGKPMFDTDMVQAGVRVKRYTYSPDLKVYMSQETGRVLEIFCKEEKYQARDGVAYGATRAKLNNVYGEAEHRQIGGLIYYIYRNPENQQQRLMVQIDNDHLYAKAWTVSVLPLDEEEAMDFAENDKFTAGWRDNEGPRFQYHLSKNVTIGN